MNLPNTENICELSLLYTPSQVFCGSTGMHHVRPQDRYVDTRVSDAAEGVRTVSTPRPENLS